MRSLSIPTRLVSLTAILLLVLVSSNLYLNQNLAQGVDALYEDARLVDNLRNAIDASQAFGDLKYWLLELAVGPRERSRDQAYRSRDRLAAELDRLERFEPEAVAVLRLEMGALMDTTMIAIEAYQEGARARRDEFLAKGLDHIRVVDRRLHAMVRVLEAEVNDRRQDALGDAVRAEHLSLFLVTLAAFVGTALTVLVLRSITVPLRRLVGATAAITAGDLDAEIPVAGRDEIGSLTRALMMLRDSLKEREWLARERESTENRLRLTETQLEHAVESISEGFSLYDQQDRLVLNNTRYVEMLYPGFEHLVNVGMTFEEATRTTLRTGMAVDALERGEQWVQERLVRHRNPSGPFVQQYANGRWLQINELKTDDGSTVAVYEDVTELIHREEELAAANREKDAVLQELNTVLDAIEYGVLFMDSQLGVRMTNRAYREIWQIPDDFHPPGERLLLADYYARTRPLYDVDDANWQAFLDARFDTLRRGVTDPGESRLRTGRILKRQVIKLHDGGRMITYFDITELKHAEEAVRRREERYALAIKGSNDGLWDWDEERGTIYVSPRCKEIAGMVRETDTIEPSEWRAMLHQDDRALHVHALLQHLRGRTEFFICECRVRGDDGRYRWVQNRGLGLRDSSGHVHRMSGSMTDVTIRKEAEIALQAAKEEAVAATRTKSRFLANMSHELRTPLNAVIGIAEMLKEDAEEEPNEARIEPLQRIVTASHHLLRLIDNILDLTKIEAGHLEVHLERFPVEELVRDVVSTAQPIADQQRNRLEVHCDPDIGSMRSDATRIRQIILNLVGNACKFTEDGRVGLRVERTPGDAGDWLTLRIEDDGIGMDDDQLEHLFEEFTQGDTSNTRRYGGTGLGLAISRRLCLLLGGDIEVTSQLNQGSTFVVSLPMELEAPSIVPGEVPGEV